jgi:SNF2 family DNA or RNA helicase
MTSLDERIDLFRQFLEKAKLDQKSYQVEGVEWCLKNELLLLNPFSSDSFISESNEKLVGGIRGGIIADEMGLGKTITMIGLCIANKMPKTLIVLPVILMEQWAEQIYRTTGHRALIYHGLKKKNITLTELKNSLFVLTTYQTLVYKKGKKEKEKEKVNSKTFVNLLPLVHWNRLVFDEAHHLRNAKTLMFSGCYELRSNIRWLMTGTPIQNREKDFYHLCAMLRIPMNVVKDNIDFVKQRFMLRRTKSGVGLLLPDLIFQKEKVNWFSKKEMAFSQTLHSSFSFLKNVDREKKREEEVEEVYRSVSMMPEMLNAFEQGKGILLRLLTASKQTCILSELVGGTLNRMVLNGVLGGYDREILSSTSKLDVVVRSLLSKKGNGNGKLVFCHYHLEMISLYRLLVKGGMKVLIYGKMPKSMGYDGPSVGGKKGLHSLGVDYEVILIQIQTGCEGLNLQEFNEIYFVSPHWNPMIEEQAVARCHRIGQSKPVFVYHFMMNGFSGDHPKGISSLDQYILDTQERKRLIIGEFL